MATSKYDKLNKQIDQLKSTNDRSFASKLADKIVWHLAHNLITKDECHALCERMIEFFQNS